MYRMAWGLALWIWGMSPAQAVSLKEIGSWVRRGEVRSVEDVVKRLPADLRARFVLMERSRSLQEASPQFPRTVLYGERGDLLISFNGEASQRGFGTLEAIERDPARLTHEIRSFDFTGPTPRVSPPNPEICMKCHRSFARPNWEPYPYWPGALGQSPKFSPEERRRLEAFAQSAPRHPLYRHLDFSRVKSRASTPAFELYAILTEQTILRAPAILAASPAYGHYRPAILGALADCPDVAAWTPELGKSISFEKYREDTLRRFQLLPAPYAPLLTGAIPSVMAKLRYLLESRNFPVDSLPNSFTERYFLTTAGSVVPQILSRMPGIPPTAPLAALSAYFQPGARPYGLAEKKAHAEFCDALKGEMR